MDGFTLVWVEQFEGVENRASVLENKWKKIPERNTKLTSRKFILGEKENFKYH